MLEESFPFVRTVGESLASTHLTVSHRTLVAGLTVTRYVDIVVMVVTVRSGDRQYF